MSHDKHEPLITHSGRTLFTVGELRCKGSGMLQLAPGFDRELKALRLALDEPMIVSSGCRSAEHNESVGGHPRSLHVCDKPHHPTGGCAAVDIRTQDAAYRARLVRLALERGWSVGVHARFIHLDRRTDYTDRNQALFLY